MLFAQVWKTALYGGGLSANSYYIDGSVALAQNARFYAEQALKFDRFFAPAGQSYYCVTLHQAGKTNELQFGSCWVWMAWNRSVSGVQPVIQPLASRWRLAVGFYPLGDRCGHRHYPGLISIENLAYNDTGFPVLVGFQDWPQRFSDYMTLSGCHWRDWLKAGDMAGIPGMALAFKSVRRIHPTGISVLNKARRARARRFQEAQGAEQTVIKAATDGAEAFEEMWDIKALELPDFYPYSWKRNVEDLMKAAKKATSTIVELQRGEDGNLINDGDGWFSRFGPQGGTAQSCADRLDQEEQGDKQTMAKLQPFTDANGDRYWHKPEADQLYELAEKWLRYCALWAPFDFNSAAQKGMKNPDRVDDYTLLWPDLEHKAENLPRPPFDPDERVKPVGLFL